jgi:hypothetical protein
VYVRVLHCPCYNSVFETRIYVSTAEGCSTNPPEVASHHHPRSGWGEYTGQHRIYRSFFYVLMIILCLFLYMPCHSLMYPAVHHITSMNGFGYFMVLDKKPIMSESSIFKEWSSLCERMVLQVILMLWSSHMVRVGKAFGWDIIPPSFAGSSLKRSFEFVWWFPLIMDPHAFQARLLIGDLLLVVMIMYFFSSISCAHVVYLLGLWTHLSWFVSGTSQWCFASRWKHVAHMDVHSQTFTTLLLV